MVKTIGTMLEEARKRSGAKEYNGHDIFDLARFDSSTKHMLIFDVLSNECSIGSKGERYRLFLTEEGYQKALGQGVNGNIKILNHAKVIQGNLHYDRKDQEL